MRVERVGAKLLNYRQTRSTATEFRLMVDCCRWSAHTEPARPPLAGEAVDWDRFHALVRRHRVQGLVWHALRVSDVAVPGAVRDVLAADAARVAAQNLGALAASTQLLERFQGAGLQLLFVKGLTLGALAYRNPFIKMSWDLDILVAPQEIEAAAVLLGELDYRPVLPVSGIEAWHRRRKESQWKAPDGSFLELHSRLADNRLMIPRIDTTSLRQDVEVTGGCTLPTLAPEPLFAYLCVHGASSNWFRLKWIADLAAILNRVDEAGIAHLYARSQQLGAGRSAAQALLLVERLFGTARGSALVAALRRDRVNRLLAKASMSDLAGDEPTGRRLGTARIHLSQLFLRSGIAFKAGEVGRQLADAITNHRVG